MPRAEQRPHLLPALRNVRATKQFALNLEMILMFLAYLEGPKKSYSLTSSFRRCHHRFVSIEIVSTIPGRYALPIKDVSVEHFESVSECSLIPSYVTLGLTLPTAVYTSRHQCFLSVL